MDTKRFRYYLAERPLARDHIFQRTQFPALYFRQEGHVVDFLEANAELLRSQLILPAALKWAKAGRPAEYQYIAGGSLQNAYEEIRDYYVVCLLRHTPILCQAHDIYTWGRVSKSARRGYWRMLGKDTNRRVPWHFLEELLLKHCPPDFEMVDLIRALEGYQRYESISDHQRSRDSREAEAKRAIQRGDA